jgi:hypothetical protein
MAFGPSRGPCLELQAAIQPGQQCTRTQQPGPGGREFQRKRQAVEPGADRSHVVGVLDEELNRAFLLAVR